MYALLRRFDLPTNSCYQEKFLFLNELSPKHALHAGREYKLPLLVYTYDGKSIRSTIGIPDMQLAKHIQAYNRAREKSGHQTTAYEQSKELWVPYGLMFCNESPPLAPAEAVSVSQAIDDVNSSSGYAIFGPRYSEVARKDNRLNGKVFYLVSGHGGPDPGAIGSKRDHALCEDEYAYDVVLRLARNIIEHGGVPYVIIRDDNDGIRDEEYLECDYDETVWGDQAIPRDQRLRLIQRSDAINELAKNNKPADQYCIVVHVDSRHVETQTDLFFYHQRNSTKSTELTSSLRDAMERNYRRNGRTKEYQGLVLTRDLHMLREVEVPTVYIELGNIQHHFDQKRVLKPTNRQALANWWTEGILQALD